MLSDAKEHDSSLKDNAKDTLIKEYDIKPTTSDQVLRDAKIALEYEQNGDKKQVELRLVSCYHPKKNNSILLRVEIIFVYFRFYWTTVIYN